MTLLRLGPAILANEASLRNEEHAFDFDESQQRRL